MATLPVTAAAATTTTTIAHVLHPLLHLVTTCTRELLGQVQGLEQTLVIANVGNLEVVGVHLLLEVVEVVQHGVLRVVRHLHRGEGEGEGEGRMGGLEEGVEGGGQGEKQVDSRLQIQAVSVGVLVMKNMNVL